MAAALRIRRQQTVATASARHTSTISRNTVARAGLPTAGDEPPVPFGGHADEQRARVVLRTKVRTGAVAGAPCAPDLRAGGTGLGGLPALRAHRRGSDLQRRPA